MKIWMETESLMLNVEVLIIFLESQRPFINHQAGEWFEGKSGICAAYGCLCMLR